MLQVCRAMATWIVLALILAPFGSSGSWLQRGETKPRLHSRSDRTELKIVAANVQLLLISPDGKRTGYDPHSKEKFRTIPDSAYYEDALLAYDTGAVDPNTTQTIDVRDPGLGRYRLVVSPGTAADGEEYEVRVKLYLRNGSEVRVARIAGTAERGKAATYELRVSADPASVVIVGRASHAAPAR